MAQAETSPERRTSIVEIRARGERKGRLFRAVTVGVTAVLAATAPVVGSAQQSLYADGIRPVITDCLPMEPSSSQDSVSFSYPGGTKSTLTIPKSNDRSPYRFRIQTVGTQEAIQCDFSLDRNQRGEIINMVESCIYLRGSN